MVALLWPTAPLMLEEYYVEALPDVPGTFGSEWQGIIMGSDSLQSIAAAIAANIFSVMSGRSLNPALSIVYKVKRVGNYY